MASLPHESTGKDLRATHQPIDRRKRSETPALPRERQRLAQLLHGTVCQELTGICFLASAAALKHGDADPEAGTKFKEIADLVQSAGAHLAEIVHDLNRPREN